MIELHHENGLEPLRLYPEFPCPVNESLYAAKMGVKLRTVREAGGALKLQALSIEVQRLLLGTSR